MFVCTTPTFSEEVIPQNCACLVHLWFYQPERTIILSYDNIAKGSISPYKKYPTNSP
jgi:hypothetical protein